MKDWKERFNKEVEEDKSMGGTLYLHKWIPNFIEQIISEKDEEINNLKGDLFEANEWIDQLQTKIK